MGTLISRIDVMVRLLVLAILFASVWPATGEWAGLARLVSQAGVFLLFFLNGLRLPRDQVLRGLGDVKVFLPLIGFCFGVMALAGWGLSALATPYLSPVVALGFVYLGVLPSTVQSATAYTSLAGGDVTTSVIAAAMLNILGVFLSAPLFALLSGGEAMDMGLDGLSQVVLMLILPFVLGQVLQKPFGAWTTQHRALVSWLDRSVIAFAVYVAFSGAVEQNLWSRLPLSEWVALLGFVTGFLAFAFGVANAVATALSLETGKRISFVFAGAHKSVAMGAPLALVLFPSEMAGLILVPLLIYHLLQLVISAPLASRLASLS